MAPESSIETHNSQLFMHRIIIQALLISVLTVYATFEVANAQKLKQVLQDEQSASFIAKAGGLKMLNDGRAIITTAKSATVLIQGQQGFNALSLAPNIFKGKKLSGIDQLPDGSLVIANQSDDRIAIAQPDMEKALLVFSKSGDDAGELNDPLGLVVSVNQKIYVTDRDNDRISVFNSQGLFLQHFGFHGEGGSDLSKPTHIALDADENIYVLEAKERNRVSIFSANGQILKQLDSKAMGEQLGHSIDFSAMTADLNGLLYLADDNKKIILIYDWRKEELLSRFGSLGQSRGQYRDISLLSVNNQGQLAVLDKVNKKIEIYQLESKDFRTPQQRDVFKFSSKRDSSCQSVHAFIKDQQLCIQLDGKGIIILSDQGEKLGVFAPEIKQPSALHSGKEMVAILEKNTLHTYHHDGQKIYSIGRYGIAPGGFDNPKHVFSAHNQVYVADTGNNRVQVFGADGQFLQQIKGDSEDTFAKVGPLAVDSQKNLYVADQGGKHFIRVLHPETKSVTRIGHELPSIHKITKTYALDLDKQDRLYALVRSDSNDFSIRLYDHYEQIEEFGSGTDYGAPLFFSDPTSLSVASTDKNTVLINDIKLKKLFSFNYHEIPAAAFGLRVVGNKSQIVLNWDSSRSPLIKYFDIQASANPNGPYQSIAKTESRQYTLNRKDTNALSWFRVRSISGLGLEARASLAKQNLYEQLDRLYKAEQYPEVIKLAQQLLKFNPGNADVLHHLAHSHLFTGQQLSSIPLFRQLERNPDYKKLAIQQQVRAYYELEEYLEAKALVDQLLELNPDAVEPYLMCTELSIQLGDAIGAVTCAEDGLAKHTENARLRYLLGKGYILAGVEDQGLAEYQTIVQNHPDDYSILLLIAEHFMQMGRYQHSLEQFDLILTNAPTKTRAIIGKAQALLKLNRDDEAKAIAIKLSASKETKGDGYYVLGKLAAKQKNYAEAVLRLTRATKVNPQNVDAWQSLAGAYVQLNQVSQATKTLGQGTDANSDSFTLNLLAGQLELQQENYPLAHAYLTKAVQLNSQSLEANKLLAKALISTRNYHTAQSYAERAAKMAPNDVDVLTLQAEIANQQGKVSSAIEFLKTGINIEPASPHLQYLLGKVYLNANLFDNSQQHLEKATVIDPSWVDPHIALGQLFSKRRLFDQAITALEKVVELDPSVNNRALLNTAYSEKKRSLEFKSNAPQLILSDLNLQHVFSAAYKKYADQPIGSVKLKNAAGTDFRNMQLSFQIKEYMDFPVTQEIKMIKGNESQEHHFKVTFNNKILDVDEDIGVQVEVKVSYNRDGQKDFIRMTQPMTIFGKNAMVWGDALMVGSFVTPKDDPVRDYVRTVINEFQPDPGPLNEKLVAAMTFFSSLTAGGTKYVIDPNTPYTTLRDDQVDYVQFPRETLRLKSGDCDDLSVLLSAGLENLGIETVLLEVPGHLLMMFNTGLPSSEAGLISQDNGLLAIHNDQVWIPIEATMVNASFTEAWAEGARKYHQALAQNNLGIIDLKQAWKQYKPVTLRKASYSINIPASSRALPLITAAKNQLLTKSINRLILPYQSMIQNDPENIDARMQIAILFSRYGLYDDAQLAFDALTELAPRNSAVHTNKGNLYLLQEEYDQALRSYQLAASLDDRDGGIRLNMSMAEYRKGNLDKANQHFQQAVSLTPELKEQYAAYSKLLSQ